MRVDVKKYLFIGAKEKKELFFQEAQKLGQIHFAEKKKKKGGLLSPEAEETVQALKVLRGLPPLEQIEDVPLDKVAAISALIVQTHEKLCSLADEMEALQKELALVKPFGAFSLETLEALQSEGNVVVQFFTAKKGTKPKDPFIVLVGEGEELGYYLSVQKTRVEPEKMVEVHLERSYATIASVLEEKVQQHAQLEKSLKKKAAYKEALYSLLLVRLNHVHLHGAIAKAEDLLEGQVFVTSGWVPVNKEPLLPTLCHTHGVLVQEVRKEKHESEPTCLQNEGVGRIGEDLVHIYDTPASNDKDPSLWVLAFFTLFFALIVADAGYGSLFFLLSMYLFWKFRGATGMKRRVMVLFSTLSVGCIVWGVLSNAYFGIELAPDNPLRKVSLVNYLAHEKASYHFHTEDDVHADWVKRFPETKEAKTAEQFLLSAKKERKGKSPTYSMLQKNSDQILLELALFVGIVHLILSMARYSLVSYSLLGWICFMVGAYLYVPAYLNYTSFAQYLLGIEKEAALVIGRDLSIVGLVAACVLSLFQFGLEGVGEISKVIQILADTLSYLRLYALGMASGILAATINELTMDLPLVIGVLIMILAHGFNMVLGVMGGVIHGLRLNFLEWYHYSFFGGGREFKPLKMLTKDD